MRDVATASREITGATASAAIASTAPARHRSFVIEIPDCRLLRILEQGRRAWIGFAFGNVRFVASGMVRRLRKEPEEYPTPLPHTLALTDITMQGSSGGRMSLQCKSTKMNACGLSLQFAVRESICDSRWQRC